MSGCQRSLLCSGWCRLRVRHLGAGRVGARQLSAGACSPKHSSATPQCTRSSGSCRATAHASARQLSTGASSAHRATGLSKELGVDLLDGWVLEGAAQLLILVHLLGGAGKAWVDWGWEGGAGSALDGWFLLGAAQLLAPVHRLGGGCRWGVVGRQPHMAPMHRTRLPAAASELEPCQTLTSMAL